MFQYKLLLQIINRRMGNEVKLSKQITEPALRKINFQYINPIRCVTQQFPHQQDQIDFSQQGYSQPTQTKQDFLLGQKEKMKLSKFALSQKDTNKTQDEGQIQITPKNTEKTLRNSDRLSLNRNNSEIVQQIRREQSRNSMMIVEDQTIKEIKIKWNSFIKLKNKDYLADYNIIEEIGRGGFGCVYRAKMKYTGITRAAKKIPKKLLKKDQTQRLFAQMAIMMSLDHPNIIKLYEVFEVKTHYMLMMELCDGGQLYNRVICRNIKEKQAAKIIKQLLRALIYIHSRGIVHRDLKPENMLFQKQTKMIKIIDFGIAVKKQPGQVLSKRLGTPYYIAPEVILKKYDQKCDLWAVGVILYMIITGYPPFRGQSQDEVLQSILRDPVMFKGNIWNKVSHVCQDFVCKLLQKNPKERMTAQQAFNHPWIKNVDEYDQKGPMKGTKTKQRTSLEMKKQVYNKISTFHFKNCLQAVVHTYVVSQLLTSVERAKLLSYFKETDINSDGVISTDQLLYILKNKTDQSVDLEKIQKLLNIIDTNQSGKIDYTEFLVASIDPKQITKQHLQRAFSYFDIDHSGAITIDQVAQFLSNSQNAQSIKKLFDLVDENSDGFISKQQFVKLMQQSIKGFA